MQLSDMRQGQSGVISKVGGSGIFRRRLLEMGFLKGKSLFVEKYAPLKDPLEVNLDGCHISLRVEEASHISMENIADALQKNSLSQ
ncbi:MAG: FeoA family protein [Desulfatibacillaceae bacterium]|nr:FeoA family protein [Desulfatibacillaceae bacterium]